MSFSGFTEDDIRNLSNGKKQLNESKASSKKVRFKTKISEPEGETTDFCENVSKAAVHDENESSSIKKVDEIKNTERKFIDLDEFENKQKLIEEQNRKRKELLAKALADRTKRTQEEAQKLNDIQNEFKKLDAMLSADVKILRRQIDFASLEYMECQKKYYKIEKEYLDVKLLLHQKQEKKEMLTEHLCTIIEKNEERKADKLNELLERLQLEPNEINGNGINHDN